MLHFGSQPMVESEKTGFPSFSFIGLTLLGGMVQADFEFIKCMYIPVV